MYNGTKQFKKDSEALFRVIMDNDELSMELVEKTFTLRSKTQITRMIHILEEAEYSYVINKSEASFYFAVLGRLCYVRNCLKAIRKCVVGEDIT